MPLPEDARYRCLKRLGKGSYGTVYLVCHRKSGATCCLKRMSLKSMSEQERARALQEAELLARLDHPNIVAYVDSFVARSRLHLFMQYCEGGDLDVHLSRIRAAGGAVAESSVLDWASQMAFALSYLHERRVLHRDLKAANVFLTRSGVVKLGDFGVSRVLSATQELASTFVGTPYYLSPELLDNRPYNAASDVWAYGCIVYEMCTFCHPFEAADFPSLAVRILHAEPPALPQPRYSAQLAALVARLLRKRPEERATLKQVLAAPIVQARMARLIEEYVAPAPVSAPTAGAPREPPPARAEAEAEARMGRGADARGAGGEGAPRASSDVREQIAREKRRLQLQVAAVEAEVRAADAEARAAEAEAARAALERQPPCPLGAFQRRVEGCEDDHTVGAHGGHTGGRSGTVGRGAQFILTGGEAGASCGREAGAPARWPELPAESDCIATIRTATQLDRTLSAPASPGLASSGHAAGPLALERALGLGLAGSASARLASTLGSGSGRAEELEALDGTLELPAGAQRSPPAAAQLPSRTLEEWARCYAPDADGTGLRTLRSSSARRAAEEVAAGEARETGEERYESDFERDSSHEDGAPSSGASNAGGSDVDAAELTLRADAAGVAEGAAQLQREVLALQLRSAHSAVV